MASTSVLAATFAEPGDHSQWRPEWTADRTCLYWYLTFPEDDVVRAVGGELLERARRTAWLDAVPARWCHVTVSDVGFTDELEPDDVKRVTDAVSQAVAGEDRLELSLGPVQTFSSAVVLAAGPLERLRAIKALVRRATSAVLDARHADVHRHLFWPHLSLGYVNRPVDASTASAFERAAPQVDAHIDVDALTLAAVTRRDGGYQWQVQAQVRLNPAGTR
jgi:2'-5' RNA ligase